MDFKAMFTELKDYSKDYDKNEIESGKAMGILSYLGILCLIPYFAEKNNKYVRFHAIQGLNLLLVSVIYGFACGFLSVLLAFIPVVGAMLALVLSLLSYGFYALNIWGIVNVCNGKAKELPLVNKIQLIKK